MPVNKETPDNTMDQRKMSFNRFRDWACGYVLVRLGAGDSIQQTMHVILNSAALNEEFGGKKAVPKKAVKKIKK